VAALRGPLAGSVWRTWSSVLIAGGRVARIEQVSGLRTETGYLIRSPLRRRLARVPRTDPAQIRRPPCVAHTRSAVWLAI
jgi:hypothetical protein